MSTPAQQAREAFGARLRELRKDARLTGRALAAAAGWHEAKVSKIEHGRQPPSETDLSAWCEHCGCADQLPDLVATVRHIEAMYVEWRREMRTGQRRFQEYATAIIGHNIERFKTPWQMHAFTGSLNRGVVGCAGERLDR
ncbi:helix-turn-helix domain-containing protein [Actinoallomurus acaciae]|uniref:Helix-turn-helix domain-containing protein n=1 Tax=Actinoallomurus acaciae TaxID=502577 RepID=A0ABV5YL10_9ACTN